MHRKGDSVPGTGLAEWLLAQVQTHPNASAQVGDLLEVAQTRGALWFWQAVLGSFIRRSSRFALAFSLAFVISQTMAWLWNHGRFGNRPDLHSIYTAGMITMMPLCTVPIILLFRFGWRDAHARFTLLLTCAAAISLVLPRHALVHWTLPAVALAIVAYGLLRTPRDWRPLQSVAQLSSAVAISVGCLFIYLLTIASLWLLGWLLHQPKMAFQATLVLSHHQIINFINITVCYLIARSSERLHKLWGVA